MDGSDEAASEVHPGFQAERLFGAITEVPERDLCPELRALSLSQAAPRFRREWMWHWLGHQRP